MDSLTQMALGATIGHAGLGRTDGRRGAVYGALLGTLPDLDVLIPLADPVAAFTYHRTWTHSLLVLTLAAPLIVALIRRFDRAIAGSWSRWLTTLWLVLATHPLLDSLTVYGTQILLPFTDYPISGSAIFIIDPSYSIPLVAAVIAALWRPRSVATQRWSIGVLALTSAYLALGMAARFSVEARVASAEPPALATLATPTPLNIFVWRVVRMHDDYYEVGFRRPFGLGREPAFERYATDRQLLEPLAGHWPAERLKWFTHGFYRVRESASGAVVMADLRMGAEGAYIFQFQVGQRRGETIEPTAAVAAREDRDFGVVRERLLEAFEKTRSAE